MADAWGEGAELVDAGVEVKVESRMLDARGRSAELMEAGSR